MAAPWFNRRDPTDIVDSGSYQVPWDKTVRIGYPLKESGSLAAEDPSPGYTKYAAVVEYTDASGIAPTIGVSENQILNGATIEAGATRNIEFRHFNRDVAVCKFGVRSMVNIDTTTATTGARLAPAVGGFRVWDTGMAFLGTLKRGDVAQNEIGEVIIDVQHIQA